MEVDLPYFDDLLARLEKDPDSPVARAFRRHVHWGLYEDPGSGADTLDAYLVAAEEMTRRMLQAGRVGDGQRICDVGCGLGGTIASMNERLSGCTLVGVNIDSRQIARARATVLPQNGNTIEFVLANACDLPFDEGAFDVVLAVECIFHFPSRKGFLEQARRVLRAGGTLAISDFTVARDRLDDLEAWMRDTGASQGSFFGSNSTAISSESYERLARSRGFVVLADEDVTAETMPTYAFWKRLYDEAGLPGGVQVTSYYEEASKRGFFEYRLLSFEATAIRGGDGSDQ